MRQYPKDGYACPLCSCCKAPGARFRHDGFLDSYVCDTCSMELDHFVEQAPAPDDPLVTSFEAIYGRPFAEYQKHHLTLLLEEAERKQKRAASRKIGPKKSREKAVRRWEKLALGYQELLDRLL